jgi:hypothetical protein
VPQRGHWNGVGRNLSIGTSVISIVPLADKSKERGRFRQIFKIATKDSNYQMTSEIAAALSISPPYSAACCML